MLNKLREAIEKKKYAVGTFLGAANSSIVEIMGYTGLDFVVIDTEHGPYDTMPMSDLIQAAESKGLSPLVRIADVTHREMQRALDNGAEGIIIPCLKSIDDFRKVVDLGKFAPLGNRGFIKGRGSGFGNEPWASGTLTEYMQNSNDKVLLLPQCETKEALDNIEEIVQIEGIDGIFIFLLFPSINTQPPPAPDKKFPGKFFITKEGESHIPHSHSTESLNTH
jgi:4-hydroxy-2-oxoheptanedioate aldolase